MAEVAVQNAPGAEQRAFKIRDTLNEEQLKLLDQFHENIKEELQNEKERRWCTDMMLCRYLRARDYDLKKSEAMLRTTLQWRREYKPDEVTAPDVLTELDNKGKMYINGKDKTGRPIIYMKPGKDNTGASHKETKVKYLVYIMEKAIQKMEESQGVEKLLWVVDFKDNSQMHGMSLMKVSKEILDILQDHYPERLGGALVINAPWVFHALWKMLTPFMTEVTKSKLQLLTSSTLPTLLTHIDADVLEQLYGGNSTFVYNFHQHWLKEDEEHPPVFEDETKRQEYEQRVQQIKEQHQKEDEETGENSDKKKSKKDKKEKK